MRTGDALTDKVIVVTGAGRGRSHPIPSQRYSVGIHHRSAGAIGDYSFSDRLAKITSFTADRLGFYVEPPGYYGMLDFDGGGRLTADFSEMESADAVVGRVMRMAFRIKAYFHTTRIAAKRAYQEAGVNDPRKELSLMEVHDCFSITELVTMEDLFVSNEGRGWRDVLNGFFDSRGAIGSLRAVGDLSAHGRTKDLAAPECWFSLRSNHPLKVCGHSYG
jgi:hypothetical protein